MSFFSDLFYQPTPMDIKAFNFNLCFHYLPEKLEDYNNNPDADIDNCLDLSAFAEQYPKFKKLVKRMKFGGSLHNYPGVGEVKFYLGQVPSNQEMGEVEFLLILVNMEARNAELFTLEHSIGRPMCCQALPNQHLNYGAVDGFHEFVYKALAIFNDNQKNS